MTKTNNDATSREINSRSLELSGENWALNASLEELAAITSDEEARLSSLSLINFPLVTLLTGGSVLPALQRHAESLEHLTMHECTGHLDLVLTVALVHLSHLKSLSITIGRLSTIAFEPCANALGVGLQVHSNLQRLTLQSGSTAFFAMSAPAARALAQGLANNTALECLKIVGCQFAEPSAVSALAYGLRNHRFLKEVQLKLCFMSSGNVLEDKSLSQLIRGLEGNPHLEKLDLTGNKCLSEGIRGLSTLLDRTHLRHLNLSCQCMESGFGRNQDPHQNNEHNLNDIDDENEGSDDDDGEFMDLSILVASLGRTKHLEHLELRFNKLTDHDMAYLAAALTHNNTIQYLGLSSNHITNTGLSIMASRIPNMTTLKRLVLTNNSYDAEGIQELADAMNHNVVIEVVELDANLQQPESFLLVQYRTDLNWAGRRYLERQNYDAPLLPSLWSLVLARTACRSRDKNYGSHLNEWNDSKHSQKRQANMLYCLLRNGPALFPM